MRNQRNVRMKYSVSGLTLIELVVALVLAAMMMVGLLRIVGIIALETNQLRGEQTDHVAAGFLADRLRTDLVNARGIAVAPDAITLSGYLDPSGLIAMVEYRKIRVGRQTVMVRRSAGGADLCWVGFGRFFYESMAEPDVNSASDGASSGLPPVPSQFQLRAFDGEGNILFSEVIRHHEAS